MHRQNRGKRESLQKGPGKGRRWKKGSSFGGRRKTAAALIGMDKKGVWEKNWDPEVGVKGLRQVAFWGGGGLFSVGELPGMGEKGGTRAGTLGTEKGTRARQRAR